jgi:hypothetical protein
MQDRRHICILSPILNVIDEYTLEFLTFNVACRLTQKDVVWGMIALKYFLFPSNPKSLW